MTYNFIGCPFGRALEAAITTKVTLVATIRPTWTVDEKFNFGILDGHPLSDPLCAAGILLDVQARRASDGGIDNCLGGSDRAFVGGVPTFSGYTFPVQLAAQAEWIEVAGTFEVDTATRHRRFYYRYRSTDPWTVQASDPRTGAATAFVYTPHKFVYAGNRFETYHRTWEGDVCKLSIRAGISGTGLSAEPGGTEIAEWHATPPHSCYTDAYGNSWSTWRVPIARNQR